MHPTNSDPRTLREVTRPALAAGAARAGRARRRDRDPRLSLHRDRADRRPSWRPRARASARRSASCTRRPPTGPRCVHHGWGEVGERLHRPQPRRRLGRDARAGDATRCSRSWCRRGCYPEIADVLLEWYGGLAERISFPLPADPAHDPEIAKVVARLRRPELGASGGVRLARLQPLRVRRARRARSPSGRRSCRGRSAASRAPASRARLSSKRLSGLRPPSTCG